MSMQQPLKLLVDDQEEDNLEADEESEDDDDSPDTETDKNKSTNSNVVKEVVLSFNFIWFSSIHCSFFNHQSRKTA